MEKARDGAAIIISSHLLHLLEEVCSHVLILKRGIKVAHGTLEEVRLALGDFVAQLFRLFGRLRLAEHQNVHAHALSGLGDKLADEAPVAGSIQLVLDGRFALYLYQGSIEGEPQHGMFTFGYNTQLDRFEASWVDSFHTNTAIMFCTGTASDHGFSVLGSYPDPTGGPDWGWRTEVDLIDKDHLTITAYNISPEGGEAKATEANLTRIEK